MDLLSDDVLVVNIIEKYLNPYEQRQLSCCNKRFYNLLPQPLRINIVNQVQVKDSNNNNVNMATATSCLGGNLFVTPVVETTTTTTTTIESKSESSSTTTTTTTTTNMDIVNKEENINNNNDDDIDMNINNNNNNSNSNAQQNQQHQQQQLLLLPQITMFDPNLYSNRRYYLWKFDYKLNCRVYLGRHLRQTLSVPQQQQQQQNDNNNDQNNTNTTTMKYRYCLGFRPYHPDQSWKITPLSLLSQQQQQKQQPLSTTTIIKDSASSVAADDQSNIIKFNSNVILSVCGNDTRIGQPDSIEEQSLTAKTIFNTNTTTTPTTTDTNNTDTRTQTSTTNWYVSETIPQNSNNNNDDDDDTNNIVYVQQQRQQQILQIILASSSLSSLSSSATAAATALTPTTRTTNHNNKNNNNDIPIYTLPTYSIPDISDKGAYLYYSPESWDSNYPPIIQSNNANSSINNNNSFNPNHRSALIEFNFWLTNGKMYFSIQKILPFQLVIPLVKLDRDYFIFGKNPIVNLFESYSARWGCIKYYMATAADVSEGCLLNMHNFINGVTDHEEHNVIYTDTTTTTTNNNGGGGGGGGGGGVDDDADADADTTTATTQTQQKLVYIDMQDGIDIDLVPDIIRDDTKIHRFFFSW